eukprot:TRINITY_DN2986_c0_g1_i1.p1 TRINITY_DN2986_c0_g1~~TRINITY_DN2986_c0_g1_i1.p1  ORF type:complete len:708 (+),score=226.62 TRINITY_DN2986_c0_g1_i1:147-2270(+)
MTAAMVVHRCRFYEWVPEQITCSAVNHSFSLLAVGRLNSDIDVWDLSKKSPFIRFTIQGRREQALNAMVWSKGDRLFTAGQFGLIHEWNIFDLSLVKTQTAKAPVNAMGYDAITEQLFVAMGGKSASSSISVFDVRPGRFYYRGDLKTKEQINTLSVHPLGLYVMAAGEHKLYKFPIPTRQSSSSSSMVDDDDMMLLEMPAPSLIIDIPKDNISSVLCLSDSTVVIGTAKGKVQMWNMEIGSMDAGFHEHQSRILSLCSPSSSSDLVYAAGEDPKICQFKKTEAGQWIYTHFQRRQAHDVVSLSSIGQRYVVAGATDATTTWINPSLFAELPGPNQLLPYPPFCLISASSDARLLLCRHSRNMTLWSLGTALAGTEAAPFPSVSATPSLLLDLSVSSEETLVSSCISEDGSYIACCCPSSVKLYELSTDSTTGQVQVKKQKIEKPTYPPMRVHLTKTELIVLDAYCITIINLSDLTSSVIRWAGEGEGGPITCSSISLHHHSFETFVAFSDSQHVYVYSLQQRKRKSKVPRQADDPYISVAFQPFRAGKNPVIAVACLSGDFHLFDLESQSYTPFSKSIQRPLPKKYEVCAARERITGISFDPAKPDTLIIWGPSFLCSVPTVFISPETETAKKRKIEVNINVIGRYTGLMFAGFVNKKSSTTSTTTSTSGGSGGGVTGSELAVVERPWIDVHPHLASAFDLKRFGR